LTAKGKAQCHALQTSFQHHNDINLVLASPLRRTIQTASLSFGPVLEKKEVPFILLPLVQEVSDMGCDTGSSLDELKQVIPKLFAEDHVKFDLTKIDFSEVKEGWNNKVCRPPGNSRHVGYE
jgi:broad specificity phosphatase PhoE